MWKLLLRKIILVFILLAVLAGIGEVMQNLGIPSPLSFKEHPIWLLVVTFIFFIFTDTILTLFLLSEPVVPQFFREFIDKFIELSKKIGIKYTPSSESLFCRLTRCLKKYDKQPLSDIRDKIRQNNITYLQPLDRSYIVWGNLFSLWKEKMKSNLQRWGLFSDLYLAQEKKDLEISVFATDLELYAKAILLNLYLSFTQDVQERQRVIIWVFTKMLPTDWPLCQNGCNQCLSGRGNQDEINFLRNYVQSFRQCATLADRQVHFFYRHILVTKNVHSKFKSNSDLQNSVASHGGQYITFMHNDINNQSFGSSFKIILNNNEADNWPIILNDAVFYGTQGGGNINWNWAICTTYASGHPVILLRIFDLSDQNGRNLLNNEMQNLYNVLNVNGLDGFTNWVANQREDL